jgi:hypothetical protein
MHTFLKKQSLFLVLLLSISLVNATTFTVASLAEYNSAMASASANDIIIWKSSATPYNDIIMSITKSNIIIKAETAGGVIFSGNSRVFIGGNSVEFSGFQFINGDIGIETVLKVRGDDVIIKDINISGVICYKYLVVEIQSRRAHISYCNFENRPNYEDRNILSIIVDPSTPGYHIISHCSFKNFSVPPGVPVGDAGVEPIRINEGGTIDGDFISRSIVEYCYFTQCNGDREIISHKSRQNIYRYNTFENNPVSELTLRHGDEGIVYGNFFINGRGGVRAREGKDHFIYNNYFQNLTESIFLQDFDSDLPEDRVRNVTILNNTFVKTGPILLEETSGVLKVENTVIANNIFDQPLSQHFQDANGTETFIGNIASGTLGIANPNDNSKIRIVNPDLELNTSGFYQLTTTSPAINASLSGYPAIPTYPGLSIDSELLLDIVKNTRPTTNTLKDVGCSEFPQTNIVKPIATSSNTGPSYITGVLSVNEVSKEEQGISVFPNPSGNVINLLFTNKNISSVSLKITDYTGKVIIVLGENILINDFKPMPFDISNLSTGLYILTIEINQGNTFHNTIISKKIIKQ